MDILIDYRYREEDVALLPLSELCEFVLELQVNIDSSVEET